jgi:DNA-binding MarR family transcriptional regulator
MGAIEHDQPEQTPHPMAAHVLLDLAEKWPTPIWREMLANRVGLEIAVLSATLDELQAAGLVRRERPRQNDEWSVTKAGDYAARLLRAGGR